MKLLTFFSKGKKIGSKVVWLFLVNSKICKTLQTNSGDLPLDAIGTSEEVLAQSHDIGDLILCSCYRMQRDNLKFIFSKGCWVMHLLFFNIIYLNSFVLLAWDFWGSVEKNLKMINEKL